MSTRIMKFVVVVGLVLGGYFCGHSTSMSVHAQTISKTSAPKVWGRVVGVSGTAIVFEDVQGTIRFYNANSKEVTVEVSRN